LRVLNDFAVVGGKYCRFTAGGDESDNLQWKTRCSFATAI
jgi:hypothetical protein